MGDDDKKLVTGLFQAAPSNPVVPITETPRQQKKAAKQAEKAPVKAERKAARNMVVDNLKNSGKDARNAAAAAAAKKQDDKAGINHDDTVYGAKNGGEVNFTLLSDEQEAQRGMAGTDHVQVITPNDETGTPAADGTETRQDAEPVDTMAQQETSDTKPDNTAKDNPENVVSTASNDAENKGDTDAPKDGKVAGDAAQQGDTGNNVEVTPEPKPDTAPVAENLPKEEPATEEEAAGEEGSAQEDTNATAGGTGAPATTDTTTPSSTTGATQPDAYDEALKGQEAANAELIGNLNDAYKPLQYYLDMMKKEDAAQTKADKNAALWQAIGEAGASIINQLGTSGAFARRIGGKGNYNTGQYSSMMKFNLSAGEMTDKAKADHERRQTRIAELTKDLAGKQAQIAIYKANGAKDLATLKINIAQARQKAAADAAALAEKQREFNVNAGLKAADLELKGKKLDSDIAANNAKIYKYLHGDKGKSGSGKNDDAIQESFTQNGRDVTIQGKASTFFDGLEKHADMLGAAIASVGGFTSFDDYLNAKKKYESDVANYNWWNRKSKGWQERHPSSKADNPGEFKGRNGKELSQEWMDDMDDFIAAWNERMSPDVNTPEATARQQYLTTLYKLWGRYKQENGFGQYMKEYVEHPGTVDKTGRKAPDNGVVETPWGNMEIH